MQTSFRCNTEELLTFQSILAKSGRDMSPLIESWIRAFNEGRLSSGDSLTESTSIADQWADLDRDKRRELENYADLLRSGADLATVKCRKQDRAEVQELIAAMGVDTAGLPSPIAEMKASLFGTLNYWLDTVRYYKSKTK